MKPPLIKIPLPTGADVISLPTSPREIFHAHIGKRPDLFITATTGGFASQPFVFSNGTIVFIRATACVWHRPGCSNHLIEIAGYWN